MSMKYLSALILANILIVPAVVHAQSEETKKLLTTKNCTACHAPGHKLVGPALAAIKAKYAGDKEANAKLVSQLAKGSAGKWGVTPCPRANVSAADAKKIISGILK